MDATTLFLLRLSGPVLLIVGISIFVNGALYKKMMKELTSGFSVMFYFAAVLPLTLGMAMVLVHNRWDTVPEILVSILGWGSLLKGVVRLLLPDVSRKILSQVTLSYLPAWAAIVVVWGGYMTWLGFA